MVQKVTFYTCYLNYVQNHNIHDLQQRDKYIVLVVNKKIRFSSKVVFIDLRMYKNSLVQKQRQ